MFIKVTKFYYAAAAWQLEEMRNDEKQGMENESEDRVVEWSQNLAFELASVWNEINLNKEKES